jgi:flagellar biosynthesis chaperone FliJ
MILHSLQELENTKKKLQELEQQYEEARQDREGDEEVREWELQSLKGLINQLKEEIVRFEAHAATPARGE